MRDTEGRTAEEFLLLHEIVKAARSRLEPEVWDYLAGAVESEVTLKRNRQAIDAIAFRPRVLRDVSHVDTRTTLLGLDMRLPVLLAPIGALETFDDAAGAAVARAASAFGTISMHSSVSDPSLEAIASAAGGPKIFQLYVHGDGAWLDREVRRIVAAGYQALCITVDLPVYALRERDAARRYVTPARRASAAQGDAAWRARYNWDDVRRFKDNHDIPLILKGIATAEDAALACEQGVDAIYVSNHGGRQLDHARGTFAVLPEVVAEVAGRAPVIVDGGVLRGTDVVKAIALGADAVGIGRLYGFGFAAAGQQGVVRVLEILEREVSTCMAELGVTRLDALDGAYLSPAEPVGPPGLSSAFPLLEDGD